MHGLVELFEFQFFPVRCAAVAGGHVLRGAFQGEGCGLESLHRLDWDPGSYHLYNFRNLHSLAWKMEVILWGIILDNKCLIGTWKVAETQERVAIMIRMYIALHFFYYHSSRIQ